MPSSALLIPINRCPDARSAGVRSRICEAGYAHQIALEAFGQKLAGALAQVVAESARVGAQHAQHQVGAAHLLAALARVHENARDEREVAQHPKQRQEREGDQAVRFWAWHAADQLQHLRFRFDAIELGAKFESVQGVEEGAAIDLAIDAGQCGVEEPKRHALRAQQPLDDLGASSEAVAERDQAFFRAALVGALAEQARACVVFRQHRLEVAVKDERAVGGAEQLARERDGARQAVVKGRHRRAKVERASMAVRRGGPGWLRGFEKHAAALSSTSNSNSASSRPSSPSSASQTSRWARCSRCSARVSLSRFGTDRQPPRPETSFCAARSNSRSVEVVRIVDGRIHAARGRRKHEPEDDLDRRSRRRPAI